MPLLDLQRRFRELGRIRMGVKNEKGQAQRLETWRLTSRNQDLIESAAELYGGAAEVWTDAPSEAEQYQVTTDVDALPIVIPPGLTLTQWYEQWGGGGCLRRCDGHTEQMSGSPCMCDEDDKDCKPTTRLNVMLPELEDLGVWRLETHGMYAAVELGGIVPFLEKATQQNIMLQARLRIDGRTVKKQDERYPRHFAVPVIDINHRLQDLLVQAGMLSGGPGTPGSAPSLTAGTAPAPAPLPAAPAQGEPREGPREATPSRTPAPLPPPEAARTPPAPPVPPSDDQPPSNPGRNRPPLTQAQKIAMGLRDIGLETDEDRHAFLSWFTQGAVNSAKDLSDRQIEDLRDLFVMIRDGAYEIVRDASGQVWAEQSGPRDTDSSTPSPDEGAEDVPQAGVTYDVATWKEAMKAAHGVGPATLIRKAREICEALGEDLPNRTQELPDMSPEAQDQLMAYLED